MTWAWAEKIETEVEAREHGLDTRERKRLRGASAEDAKIMASRG